MTLDDLRKKVIYQNTLDVWIGTCEEKNIKWDEPENYKKFITYLLNQKMNMKKFPLCVSDSDSNNKLDQEKAKFSEVLSQSQDQNSDTYTIRLNDSTINLIREFHLE